MQRGLKVLKGPKDIGRVVVINPGVCVCGRTPENQLFLASEKVSKKHCSFTLEGELFFVKDLGSSNGTFVNGEKVQESNLKRGDRVQVGEYLLEVVTKGAK